MHAQTYEQLSNLEVTPNAQLVIDIDLTNRYPFVICADTGKLSVCKARSRRREGASSCSIITVGRTCFPRVVCNFMVILRIKSVLRTMMEDVIGAPKR